jgi:D-serine deaminase-like pyridoxal phosphate-dependent protein
MSAPQTRDYSYYRNALAGQRLPAAFIDLDCLDANVESLRRRAGALPIRIVTKSIRCVAIIQRLLAAGPFFQGLLCYSPAEAAWLAEQGFDDLVVAYPSVEPAEIGAVALQIRAGRTITLMVDHPSQLDRLDGFAAAAGVILPVAIDLDMSSEFPGIRFGVYRSPVDGAAPALVLADEIARRTHLRLDGLMGYEGQIAGLMDDVPGRNFKNRIVRFLKHRSTAEVNARRRATVTALETAGHRLRFVNGGGTGSFESTRQDSSVTELAAGSGVYLPALFDHYAAFHGAPAAGFALPITRVPRPGIVTCSGGGYPASGPAGTDRLPLPWLPEGCSLVLNEGAGEVQTPVRHPRSVDLAIGDPMLFRHAKSGELCEHFNQLHLIRAGQVVKCVTTYRGDGKCFF